MAQRLLSGKRVGPVVDMYCMKQTMLCSSHGTETSVWGESGVVEGIKAKNTDHRALKSFILVKN